MAAYAGPPAPLSVLLSDPPWALSEQAWRGRVPGPEGTNAVNVDGTGVVWWPAGEPRDRPEPGLAGALGAAVVAVEKVCADAGETATLTLLAADGERIAGVRAALGRASHPLFTRAGDGVALAASEPLDDDPGWMEVPDRHLVELDADGSSTRPLE
jgi:predicted glutamine amidotransferase